MPQIDIKLASQFDPLGLNQAAAGLQNLHGKALDFGREWEHTIHKLERKFSIPDIGFDLMRAFGIGGGGAIVERAISSIFEGAKEKAKEAEEAAKKFGDELARLVDTAVKLGEKKEENFIEALAPAAKIAAKKKQIAELTAQMEEATKKRDDAAAAITNANTLPAKLMNLVRGSPEPGNWDNVVNQKQADKDNAEWAKKQVDTQMEAAKQLLELDARRTEIEKSLAAEQKKLAEETEKAVGKESADKVKRLTDSLRDQEKAFDAIVAAQKKSNDEFTATQKEADAIRAQTSELAKYKQEVAKINELRGKPGGLTNTDADAAIAHLDAERQMNVERAKEQSLSAQLAAVADQRTAIENNGLLTKQEKTAQILPLLAQENKLIADRIGLLDKEADGASDPALVRSLRDTIDRLQKELTRRQGEQTKLTTAPTKLQSDALGVKNLSDSSEHYQSGAGGMAGSLMQQVAQIGTWGDQINRTFANVGQSIRQSLGGAFADMVLKGGSFKSKLVGLYNGVVTSFVQSGAQMLADWIMKHTLMAAWSSLFHTTDVGMTVAGEATKTSVTAAGTGSRILFGLKEGAVWLWQAGVKAMSAVANIPYVGPFLAIAALAAVIAGGAKMMKGFENGGIIGGGEQVIRVNEGNKTEAVLNARATSMLGHDWINAANAGVMVNPAASITRPGFQPQPAARAASGGGSLNGGGGRSTKTVFVDARDHNAIEQLKRDPRFATEVVQIMKNNRLSLGIRI